MRSKLLIIAVAFFTAVSFAGCAAGKKQVKGYKRVKKISSSDIKMTPLVEIALSKTVKKIYVEEFKNTTSYPAAGIIFSNALRSKLMDRGFQIVDSKDDSDIFFEGSVFLCKYETTIVGLARSMGNQLAYGKAGREHTASMGVNVNVSYGEKPFQIKLTGETRTFEQEITSGVNDISLKVAQRLVGAIKIGGK